MPARNYKAEFGLAVKIYSVYILILNNISAICLVNTKPQNNHMHCYISPKRTGNPCGSLYNENQFQVS